MHAASEMTATGGSERLTAQAKAQQENSDHGGDGEAADTEHEAQQPDPDQLVDQRLAACVSLMPGVTSVYAWEGRRETAEELQLLIKTRAECYPALERKLLELHPYELPEIVAVPIEKGLTAYVEWVAQCTTEQA